MKSSGAKISTVPSRLTSRILTLRDSSVGNPGPQFPLLPKVVSSTQGCHTGVTRNLASFPLGMKGFFLLPYSFESRAC